MTYLPRRRVVVNVAAVIISAVIIAADVVGLIDGPQNRIPRRGVQVLPGEERAVDVGGYRANERLLVA